MTWEFGGTVLDMVANSGKYGVEEISSPHDLPTVRGENPKVPLREGSIHGTKIFDERVISLGMWVVGSSISDYESRIDTLKKLFGLRSRQTLKRTMGDGSVREAPAEVADTLGFNRIGPTAGRFTVDFLIAEGFMRSNTLTDTGQINISSSPHDFTLTNPGTAEDRSAIITFHGDLEDPKLTNLDNGIWVGIIGALTSGQSYDVDVSEFSIDPSDYDVLQHSGDNYFMVLNPGDNNMRLETNTMGGWIQIKFYAPFL